MTLLVWVSGLVTGWVICEFKWIKMEENGWKKEKKVEKEKEKEEEKVERKVEYWWLRKNGERGDCCKWRKSSWCIKCAYPGEKLREYEEMEWEEAYDLIRKEGEKSRDLRNTCRELGIDVDGWSYS